MNSLKYVSAAGRARWAAGALTLIVILDIVSVGSSVMQLNLITDLQGASPPSEALINANDSREQTIGLIYFGAYILTIVVFLQWLHRIVANLVPIGAHSTWSPGWAVGAWFVPFLNLVRPYQIVKEAWDGSDPNPAGSTTTSMLGGWWALWIIGNILSNITYRMADEAATLETISAITMMSIAASLLSIGAGIFIIRIVRQLTARQDDRATHRVAAYEVFD
jgi:hypothetical protein